MSKQAAWLHAELPQWIRDGLVDQTTADAIASRYPTGNGQSWGLFILTAIGAIIFGLGIILFFAYNWADMPKPAKLALVFTALLISHGIALWLRGRHAHQHNLIEGFHILGTMMFGAGIWLVAQIYNLNEHYPTAVLVWGVGALSLAWALPSVIQGLLACVLLSVWGLSETLDFQNVNLASIALVAIGILPLAWMQRSRTLLLFGLVSLLGLGVFSIGNALTFSIVFNLLFAASLLLIAAAYLTQRTSFPGSAQVLRGIGVVIYGVCLLILTFETDLALQIQSLPGTPGMSWQSVANVLWLSFIITALLWFAMLVPPFSKRFRLGVSTTKSFQHYLILASLLLLMTHNLGWYVEQPYIRYIAYNLILAAHSILLIIRGTDSLQWKQTALGAMMLMVLIMARFVDLFDSLLMRSLAFILIGAMLFVIGHQYSKRKRQGLSHA